MKPLPVRASVLTSLLVLLCGAASLAALKSYFQVYTRKAPIHPEGGHLVSSIARETPSWVQVGNDKIEPEDVVKVLGTPNYLTRIYVEKSPPPGRSPRHVSLHVAYYTGGIDTVPHVPDRCFVGGGMQIGAIVGNLPLSLRRENWLRNDDVPDHRRNQVWRIRIENPRSPFDGRMRNLPFLPDQIALRTMKFLQKDQPVYSGYFFIANGSTVCEAERVRLLAFDLTSRYAYYMKVQVTSSDVRSGEELAEVASSLIAELIGDLMMCVPDWVEVEAGRYPPATPR
jgi:hypothetical protein